ncbi:PspC domain-containing protein [Dyadobacter arcticus]|uniref:Phage shock protein PspC (Stress-responsive transcriptional regulator) n=1 Tax=Dyadobacter arcticus TaxID=1078754 RepID=A0ABX0UDW1_9BACT|nr:PspC domain-containing protein [Dyadobacter arcticus]NIJ51182.1 phage shock protein PspC (stress-responsive transcriptional regulator) [Dyadobacter arcticus]
MNHNRLFRNSSNKMIGGVASGLAEYFDIDVTILRVILVLAVFIPVTFPVIIIYITLWIVMPDIAKRPKSLEEGKIPS